MLTFLKPSRMACLLAISAVIPLTSLSISLAEDEIKLEAKDVIYGRKWGTALTLDVYTPTENKNGLGVILVQSGGWFSAKGALGLPFMRNMLKRGYTVFSVVHGSQPKYTIPEVLEDMHRSVRFIRHNAATYQIDPTRIGIYGGSAGGHLSLMQGAAGKPGDPQAKDPVDREESRVQAVACFYPPTDFLNYGETGNVALGTGVLKNFRAPFDFQELDPATRSFVPVTDAAKLLEIGKAISPVYHVDSADAPMLIIHGDADKLVPIQQSELMMNQLQAAGVPHELVVRKDAVHGWPGLDKDIAIFADWFDKYLLKQPVPETPK